MTHYRISGIDSESGLDTELTVNARDDSHARLLAATNGIEHAVVMPVDVDPLDDCDTTIVRPRMRWGRLAAALGVTALLVAGLYYSYDRGYGAGNYNGFVVGYNIAYGELSGAVTAKATTPQQFASIEQQRTKPLAKPTGRVAKLVELLASTDRKTAFDAVVELGEMGPGAINAIPALVELATRRDNGAHKITPSYEAGKTLHKIDAAAAVPYLARALGDPYRRFFASRILGKMGNTATPAIPALIEAVRAVTSAQTRDERDASNQAGCALGDIRPRGLSALISEMTHDNVKVRQLAVWAVPRGPVGKPAVPELSRRISDEDPLVRASAANSLAHIGAEAEDAIMFIKLALDRETNGNARFNMHFALDSINESLDSRE